MTIRKPNHSWRFFRPHFGDLIVPGILAFLVASPCLAQNLILTPLNPTGIYKIGEQVGWTVSLPPGETAPPGFYKYTMKENNFKAIATGAFKLSSGKTIIDTAGVEPAMLYVQVTPPQADSTTTNSDGSRPERRGGKPIIVGAAVAPTQLQPSAPRPADFDAFWDSKIQMLQAIPPNPVLAETNSDKPGVDFFIVTMDHIEGRHIHGQLAKPSQPGKFPGLVIFQWASPPYPLQKQWVTDRAAEGWLALNIEPHDVLPDQPPSYYQSLPTKVKKYESIGQDDRDKCYFLQMYLADYRAVEYLASRPDWDGKTLVVMGTSMGGQQSLCVAGLNSKITDVIVNEPAGCDPNGPLHGRASGYPNWPSDNPKIMETSLYFDPVNFAPHIKVPTLVAMGFVDTTAPPVGIWTAFNQINAPKEAVPMIDSPHNHLATPVQQRLYTSRSAEWLDVLVKGGQVSPR